MAILWLDGFDVNTSADGDGYTIRYPGSSLPTTMEFASGNYFGFSLKGKTQDTILPTPQFTEGDVWFTSCDLLLNNVDTDMPLFTWKLASATQLVLRMNETTDGELKFEFVRGSTVLGSYTMAYSSEWFTVETKVNIHTSTGTYELRINGVSVLSDTGANTADSASNNADNVVLQVTTSSATKFLLVDNWIVFDDSGSDNTDWLGSVLIEEKLPSSNGEYIEWTTKNESDVSYENIDDQTKPDMEDTYNAADDTDLTDTFIMQPLVVLVSVLAVQLEIVAAVEGNAENIKAVTIPDDTEDASDNLEISADTETYESVHHVWEDDPDASDVWTTEVLAVAQFGYRSAV